jgi:N-acetylglucosamine kinase-like BadF-type ATPase
VILAVDGGNSKTDLALVDADGSVQALVRGGLSSPHHLGLEQALDVLEGLREEAGANGSATVGLLAMAGVDFPSEEQEFLRAASGRGWAQSLSVVNDTFAVLRAGTERGWGVAITCGAGINCVGVAPDGRHARFPALGSITGDWGGGYDVGLTAVSAAARSEDGRGPRTTLERSVPAFFGVATPLELAEAIHRGRIEQRRVIELAPLVLAEAADDAVAAEIVEKLAEEIVTMARVALTRLGLELEPVEVLVGGGLFRTSDHRLLSAVESGLRELAPDVIVRSTGVPSIVGAALLGLDALAAPVQADAHARAREELSRAVNELESAPAGAGMRRDDG